MLSGTVTSVGKHSQETEGILESIESTQNAQFIFQQGDCVSEWGDKFDQEYQYLPPHLFRLLFALRAVFEDEIGDQRNTNPLWQIIKPKDNRCCPVKAFNKKRKTIIYGKQLNKQRTTSMLR